MNYNMQGITKMIPKLFAMLKLAKVEIKKKHQVLMVDVGENDTYGITGIPSTVGGRGVCKEQV